MNVNEARVHFASATVQTQSCRDLKQCQKKLNGNVFA